MERYEKFIFMSKEKEKEWDELNSCVKNHVMSNLYERVMQMESKVDIEMLCHVVNDLIERIEKLETDKDTK